METQLSLSEFELAAERVLLEDGGMKDVWGIARG